MVLEVAEGAAEDDALVPGLGDRPAHGSQVVAFKVRRAAPTTNADEGRDVYLKKVLEKLIQRMIGVTTIGVCPLR